ncbi:hypothetical protein BDP27DRAFT_1402031 [Rhodocollybia butyracea]|uniref:C2H2-type domain-containing protein n=1 Tax=Rhodocollybia butyracea TaxID=206335 RepID=A0A9P5PQI4_9AGAR|nr:hypothetical protein BDP27DRAFT_1402031 [Rhodocollybia butyracea]
MSDAIDHIQNLLDQTLANLPDVDDSENDDDDDDGDGDGDENVEGEVEVNNEADDQGQDEDVDSDSDSDIDAEAEEMARKLNEQLWEDMRKAASVNENTSTQVNPAPSKKEHALLTTINVILALLSHDTVAHTTLSSVPVPNTAFSSVLDAFKQTVSSSGKIPKATAVALSQTLVSLAGNEALFGKLRGRATKGTGAEVKTEAATGSGLGKRKREERPTSPAPPPPPSKIYSIVTSAVHVVTHALHTSPSINPALITSIQGSLQKIFAYAVTAGAKPDTNTAETTSSALQEISALIQVLGVLSGIQIGIAVSATGTETDADTDTRVYPCMVPSCTKTFARSASLDAHERTCHQTQPPTTQPPLPSAAQTNSTNLPTSSTPTSSRPHACPHPPCTASFLRNHDLKRHIKVTHERKSFICGGTGGCGKTFSRRDAIKRHRDASAAAANGASGGKEGSGLKLCHEGEIIEVDGSGTGASAEPEQEHEASVMYDEDEGDDAAPDAKRSRLAVDAMSSTLQDGDPKVKVEEEITSLPLEAAEGENGEILQSEIHNTSNVVLQLHPLLRAVVAKAAGGADLGGAAETVLPQQQQPQSQPGMQMRSIVAPPVHAPAISEATPAISSSPPLQSVATPTPHPTASVSTPAPVTAAPVPTTASTPAPLDPRPSYAPTATSFSSSKPNYSHGYNSVPFLQLSPYPLSSSHVTTQSGSGGSTSGLSYKTSYNSGTSAVSEASGRGSPTGISNPSQTSYPTGKSGNASTSSPYANTKSSGNSNSNSRSSGSRFGSLPFLQLAPPHVSIPKPIPKSTLPHPIGSSIQPPTLSAQSAQPTIHLIQSPALASATTRAGAERIESQNLTSATSSTLHQLQPIPALTSSVDMVAPISSGLPGTSLSNLSDGESRLPEEVVTNSTGKGDEALGDKDNNGRTVAGGDDPDADADADGEVDVDMDMH